MCKIKEPVSMCTVSMCSQAEDGNYQHLMPQMYSLSTDDASAWPLPPSWAAAGLRRALDEPAHVIGRHADIRAAAVFTTDLSHLAGAWQKARVPEWQTLLI